MYIRFVLYTVLLLYCLSLFRYWVISWGCSCPRCCPLALPRYMTCPLYRLYSRGTSFNCQNWSRRGKKSMHRYAYTHTYMLTCVIRDTCVCCTDDCTHAYQCFIEVVGTWDPSLKNLQKKLLKVDHYKRLGRFKKISRTNHRLLLLIIRVSSRL